MGETTIAWQIVRRSLPAGPETPPGSVRFLLARELQLLAAALALDAGDVLTARTWLDTHSNWQRWSGAVLGESEGQALWAQYHRQAGEMEQAWAYAERALAHATAPRQPLALIAAHRLLGELDTEAHRFDAAAAHLQESLALADACAAPYERALALLAMAELRAAMAAATEAATFLEEARTICERLGAKPALARADALAGRLSSSPIMAAYPAGLTAREVEVLRLVAAGLMNSEIAARLFLSERTIEQHLRSVYNKLGSSSRTAATRFAIENHLA